MSQTVPRLQNLGWKTVNCTIMGWLPPALVTMQRLLEMLRVEDLAWKSVMIFGLLSNFAHRYRQCDYTRGGRSANKFR